MRYMLLALTFMALACGGLVAENKPSGLHWEFDVPVRMRDGVRLAADVFLPAKEGKWPAILIRTPYGKEGHREEAVFFAQHGFAVVVQDARGRFESDGEWYAFSHEANDGYDTIEWAALQPWSNGKVVTMGGSYMAIDQWLAATRRSSHLAAMVSFVCPSDLYDNALHNGGAFLYGTALTWSMGTGRHARLLEEMNLVSWPELFRHLPVELAAAAGGFEPGFYRDWVEHASRDAYWMGLSWREIYSKLAVPVFHVGGWFDLFQQGTIENFERMTREAPEGTREAQRLVIGPWAHGVFGPKVGEVDFGKESAIDIRAKELRWLDHYIKGEQNGAENDPPVEVFMMGANQWRSEKTWPPAQVKPTRFFLHSQSKAKTAVGDGTLSNMEPLEEPPDRFDYDPSNPVPTHGGGTCCNPLLMPWGAMDQREIESRDDVLVYSTPPLESALEVMGPVEVHLVASTTARDTDWTAKLVDIAPNGFAMNLTDGILRSRFHKSTERPELLEPGKVYSFVVDAGSTSNVFLKGHQLRLEISSSNFPRFSRNTNTGNVPEKDSSFRVAHQTIFHDAARASCILLWVGENR